MRVEAIMYFAIGFLVAAFFSLLFFPLLHNRAVRLTKRRLDAGMPASVAELRADKDQLRAQFAVSIRKLEIMIDKMKSKTATYLGEVGKKNDYLNRLRKELGEKNAMIVALEVDKKTLGDQLRDSEAHFDLASGSLRRAERELSNNEAVLATQLKALAEYGDLLNQRENQVKQLNQKIVAAAEVEARLRNELAIAQSRARIVAKFYTEIDRLEAQVRLLVDSHSVRRPELLTEAEASWTGEWSEDPALQPE
jgi:chromosome segregation ATPase